MVLKKKRKKATTKKKVIKSRGRPSNKKVVTNIDFTHKEKDFDFDSELAKRFGGDKLLHAIDNLINEMNDGKGIARIQATNRYLELRKEMAPAESGRKVVVMFDAG